MSTTDERLERYLHDRSATIELPHAGVEAITRRARRHRRRRTAACGGVAAALLVGGVAVALVQPAPDEEVGSRGAAVVDSPLEWSVVPVRTGIGWASSAISDGEAVYSLSTAPGPEAEGTAGEPRRLYRSDDGTDWELVDLPEGLSASGVAGLDGSVYAVGTAAAGGEVTGVELAVSGDGGAGWDTSAVPLDLGALAEGFPGRVRAVDAEVAVSGGTTVVVVSIVGSVDPAVVLPDEPADTWYQQTGGLARVGEPCVSQAPDPEAPVPASTEPPTTAPPAPAETLAPDASGRALAACEDDAPEPEVRTWAELGLTPEQAALAEGQTHLFTAAPDGALEPVEVVGGASFADPTSSRLLAADDGWWLMEDEYRGQMPSEPMEIVTDVVALHSADGRTWTPAPVAEEQMTLAMGVVAGRPVIVTMDSTMGPQTVSVHRIEAGGAVTTIGLNELVGLPAGTAVFGSEVGPLGVAVVVGTSMGGTDTEMEVLTSLDGLQFSRQEVPDPDPGTKETVNGVTITPDAVKVRLSVRDADDQSGGPPAAQRLFVGTPAG
jgi:hypothetical protein